MYTRPIHFANFARGYAGFGGFPQQIGIHYDTHTPVNAPYLQIQHLDIDRKGFHSLAHK